MLFKTALESAIGLQESLPLGEGDITVPAGSMLEQLNENTNVPTSGDFKERTIELNTGDGQLVREVLLDTYVEDLSDKISNYIGYVTGPVATLASRAHLIYTDLIGEYTFSPNIIDNKIIVEFVDEPLLVKTEYFQKAINSIDHTLNYKKGPVVGLTFEDVLSDIDGDFASLITETGLSWLDETIMELINRYGITYGDGKSTEDLNSFLNAIVLHGFKLTPDLDLQGNSFKVTPGGLYGYEDALVNFCVFDQLRRRGPESENRYYSLYRYWTYVLSILINRSKKEELDGYLVNTASTSNVRSILTKDELLKVNTPIYINCYPNAARIAAAAGVTVDAIRGIVFTDNPTAFFKTETVIEQEKNLKGNTQVLRNTVNDQLSESVLNAYRESAVETASIILKENDVNLTPEETDEVFRRVRAISNTLATSNDYENSFKFIIRVIIGGVYNNPEMVTTLTNLTSNGGFDFSGELIGQEVQRLITDFVVAML